MGLSGHIRILENRIDCSVDTASTSRTSTMPSPALTPPLPCTPTATSSTTPSASSTPTTLSPTHASSPRAPTTIPVADTDTADFPCPHCPCAFASHVVLVGHLRIHRTETDEPVNGAPTYTRRICLNCPHCTRTFMHPTGLLGHMRVHENLQ
ncbi:hypothetical protein SprV_0200798300 [Sparganum proliferum]